MNRDWDDDVGQNWPRWITQEESDEMAKRKPKGWIVPPSLKKAVDQQKIGVATEKAASGEKVTVVFGPMTFAALNEKAEELVAANKANAAALDAQVAGHPFTGATVTLPTADEVFGPAQAVPHQGAANVVPPKADATNWVMRDMDGNLKRIAVVDMTPTHLHRWIQYFRGKVRQVNETDLSVDDRIRQRYITAPAIYAAAFKAGVLEYPYPATAKPVPTLDPAVAKKFLAEWDAGLITFDPRDCVFRDSTGRVVISQAALEAMPRHDFMTLMRAHAMKQPLTAKKNDIMEAGSRKIDLDED